MKRIVLALVALLSLAAQVAYPYAIMNDKDSAVPVTIYVFKDGDKYLKYLKARGVPDTVIQAAGVVAGAAPVIGGVLAAPTGGISAAVATGVVIGAGAAGGIVKALQESGFMDEAIKRAAGIIATHRNVQPGNNTDPYNGRDAEFGWKDIQDQFGLPQGSQLFFVFTSVENDPKILFQAAYPSDGKFGIKVTKDADGKLTAARSYSAENAYVPAAVKSGPQSLWDRAKGVFERGSGTGAFFNTLKDTAVNTYEQVNKAGDDLAKQQADLAKSQSELAKQQADLVKSQNTKLNK